MTLPAFIFGLVVGSTIGVLLMALLVAGRSEP